MKRSIVIAGLSAIGVFVASATPAHALNISNFTDSRSMSVRVSDCAPTAAIGSKCRGFVIEASITKTQDGVVSKGIGVEGYDLTVNGPGGAANGTKVSEGSTGSGTITIASTARTGSLKFTVVLACDPGPCTLSGSFTFSVSARKGAASTYGSSGGGSHTESLPSCTTDSGGSGASLETPATKGTVKSSGSTKVLRSLPGADGAIGRSYSYTKIKGDCL